MDKTQEQSKRCFCARCFIPIEDEEQVGIEGQNFHRICSMCCICRTIPTSLKMFYGHVFCNECFKTHVLSRFRGEDPRVCPTSWWMQWAPGAKPQETKEDNDSRDSNPLGGPQQEPAKKSICARCLQAMDENDKIDIGEQSFHSQCAKCYVCHAVPSINVKIYYGQVFCEECFHRHVLNRNKDNPAEFFKNCFEQWQSNGPFADSMRDFMTGNKDNAPFIFMMQGAQPPFCRCGTGGQEWFQPNEPKKSVTTATASVADESLETWDLSFENHTEVSDLPEYFNIIEESANKENLIVAAAEKIEKLTKYLYERDDDNITNQEKWLKKWKNFIEFDKISMASEFDPTFYEWTDMQMPKVSRNRLECPKCLWQCGPIYVNSEYLQKVSCCGENC